MKITHFLLWVIIIPLFMEACSSDELDNAIVLEGNEILKIEAVISPFDVGETESRTAFNFGSTSVDTPVWAEGDTIGIYPSAGGDQLSFPIIEGVGTKTCVFTGGGWALKASTATETYTYTAYSPFNRNYYMLEDNTELPISMLGQKQIGNNNSSHLGAYHIQIANGDTPTSGKISFKFKHKVAFVRMDIVAPSAATWKSITLESNATFTTQATMDLSLDVPVITPVAQSNSVTLELENIKTTADDPSIVAYMVVLPVDFTGKTLTMKLTDSDDNIYTIPASIENPRGVDNPRKFDAASARWISTDFERIRYVTFTADAEQTLTMSKAVGTLQYSVNGSAWNELGTNTIEFGGSKGNLRLRGKSLTGTSAATVDYNNYSTIIFGNNTPVACTGDIRTLIDYENYTTAKTENARFRNLFENCTSLTSAPDLPAEVLADFCYGNMFEGCKSLQEPPQLPAKTIPSGGYYHMFEGCSSLIKAPELPAMTVGSVAYNTMFAGCTSLIDAPELPATTLEGENHYACMFMNCTSLKNIPTILPSMIATSNSYANMFDGCVSITTAPVLPATTVSLWCYDSMFKGCVSLINAPEELPATELAPQCYPNMFSGCKNLKKAPKLPATKLTEQCYSGMFSGCTSLETAPELPATELATTCYSSMFAGCISLEVSPKLIASKLESSCYNRMFFGCSKLNKIFMYATDISASFCLEHWVEGVSSTGTFYKASAMKSLVQDNYDYTGIPIGDWTVKNYDTNNGGALDKSVTISKAGTLSQIITDEEKYEIKSLTITGELNGDDILYLREMAGVDVKGYSTGGVLSNLDIKNATIVEGGGYYFAFETSSLNAFYTKTSQISDYMFYGTKLEEIILPLNTTSIGPSSFSACYKLKGMSIPSNVITIAENAFSGCSNLTSIEIPYGVTTIGFGAFQNCTGLTSIKLSETVNTISTSAFSGCSNLTSIEIPYGVTTIGHRAFQNCTGLTSMKLSETVNSISSSAFNGIHSLAFEVAENNNTYSAINGVLFSKDRTALIKYCLDKTNPNYTIPNTTISIGDDAFYNSEISEIILPNSVESIGNSSFSSCSKLTSVTLNEGLKEIGSGAFSQCNSLKTITIPNYVTSLTATFSNNKGVTSVTLSEKLEVLGANTFNGCSNMVSIKLPESLLEIGEYAFKGTGLTTVTVPENVKTIDGTAFDNTNITELHFKGTTPPEQGLFSFNYEFKNNCTLYVPNGSIKAYRNSSVWKYFKTIIEE